MKRYTITFTARQAVMWAVGFIIGRALAPIIFYGLRDCAVVIFDTLR